MFWDRTDAGRQLAQALLHYKGQDVVVFALPRGGVVLGVEVAAALDAPLELTIVRKVRHPQSLEYAIGAVTEDGYLVTNPRETAQVDRHWLAEEIRIQQEEARHRREIFSAGRDRISAEGKIAIVVDDGLATGFTMSAAVHDIRRQKPKKLVVAVPVAAAETADRLRDDVDELIVVQNPPTGWFGSVGAFYEHFDQVTDEEVVELMKPLPAH